MNAVYSAAGSHSTSGDDCREGDDCRDVGSMRVMIAHGQPHQDFLARMLANAMATIENIHASMLHIGSARAPQSSAS